MRIDPPSISEDETSEIRVLHVDDDPAFANVVATFLERAEERLTVDTAASADEGIVYLQENDVDCIVSDHDMAGQTGIEFLETVRETSPDLPFILFTGKGSEEVASEAISAGVTDYLQKESGTDQYAVLAHRILNSVERFRAEREADRTRTQLEAIAQNTVDGIVIIDAENEIRFANPAMESLFGYRPAELVEESITTLMPPQSRVVHQEAVTRYVETGERTIDWRATEFLGQHRDGHEIPISISFGEFEHDGDKRFVGIIRDISERKERERGLEHYENVLEAAGDGVYVLDLDGHFRMVNDRFVELTGYDRSELLGSHVSVYLDDEDIETGERLIKQLLTTDTDVVHMDETIHTADGREVPAEARITLLEDESGRAIATTGVLRDVSERSAREHELERYETIFEELNDGIYVLDDDEEIVYVNERYASMKGVDRQELLGTRITQWVAESTLEHARALRRELQAGTRDVGVIETVLRTVDGEEIPVELRLVTAERSGTAERIGVVRDITERKSRERELERTRDLAERTKRIADVGGWELNPQTMEVFWTEHLFDIFDLDGDEAPPLEEALEVYHEDDQPIIENAIETALDSGDAFDIEVRFRRPDGEIRWVRVQGTPTLEDGEVVTLRGAVQDITEQKAYQQELERQNTRLEEFASVVSHDLRNPLHVAKGRLKLTKEDCDSEHIEPIEHAHERMDTLITDLLALAREGEAVTDRESVEIAPVVGGCWTNVETGDATLVTDIERPVYADKSRLKQVFENLFRNSIEHGGDTVVVTIGELADGFYLEDDGPGIPESEREDVFDAGYSTSEDGTGFGLSIVKRITDAHGWEIAVTEGSDGGARFEITGVEFADK